MTEGAYEKMNKIYRVLGKWGRITIPFDIRRQTGFRYNDIVSFTAQDDRSVIVRREKLCDGCQASVPNGEKDGIALLDFLDGLPDAEQREALIHLSVKWAAEKAGEKV